MFRKIAEGQETCLQLHLILRFSTRPISMKTLNFCIDNKHLFYRSRINSRTIFMQHIDSIESSIAWDGLIFYWCIHSKTNFWVGTHNPSCNNNPTVTAKEALKDKHFSEQVIRRSSCILKISFSHNIKRSPVLWGNVVGKAADVTLLVYQHSAGDTTVIKHYLTLFSDGRSLNSSAGCCMHFLSNFQNDILMTII